MINIGALSFTDTTDAYNRYAETFLDASADKTYSINLGGTDDNGDPIIPGFVTIDNYNNNAALTYSIDNFEGSLAPYTTVQLAVAQHSQNVTINLTSGIVRILVSEKKLPIVEGTKYTGDQSSTVTTKYRYVFAGSATFTIPDDWNAANNKIHCFGAGSNGLVGTGASAVGAGGGAGAYNAITNVNLAAGSAQNCQVPAANSGLNCWAININKVLSHSATANTQNGANTVDSVGPNPRRGGNGSIAGGGGGAPGIDASANDAPSSIGGAGGGTGGGLGGVNGSGVGGNATTFSQTSDAAKAGPGGGGGASSVTGTVGGAAGKYGAGGGGGKGAGTAGGAGGDGIIVLQWTP